MERNSVGKGALGVIAILLYVSSWGLSAASLDNYESIQIDADLRHYRLFVPTTYSAKQASPLVLNFHGTSNTPEMQEGLSGFEQRADAENFIVVTPLALFKRSAEGPITWNVDKETGPDDVRFITELLASLKHKFAIDEKRIYATGFSGGARMSSRLACDLSATVAAIGPVAGVRFPADCKPSRAVPVITFHGEKDPVNHYVLQKDSPVYWSMGVEDALAGWVKNNQCKAPTQTIFSSSLTRLEYQECYNHADIIFYRSTEAGHTWPGNPVADKLLQFGLGKTEQNLAATELIWQFFKAHPLP